MFVSLYSPPSSARRASHALTISKKNNNLACTQPNANDTQTGIYIFNKRKAMKGVWSHQAIVPPLSAVDFEYQNQFGFTPNPAVDVDGVSKEAYLVSSTTNDPDFNLRITALTGLPPDVAFSTEQVLSNKFAYPVDIPQPVIGRPIAGGDARFSSNPVLRVTKIKGEQRRKLRLYAIHTVANEAEILDGFRVYTVGVSKNKGNAAFALENSVDLFTQSDVSTFSDVFRGVYILGEFYRKSLCGLYFTPNTYEFEPTLNHYRSPFSNDACIQPILALLYLLKPCCAKEWPRGCRLFCHGGRH